MKSLLEAISPTANLLLNQDLFSVRYTWEDALLGTLEGQTVIIGADPEAALNHFRSIHKHLTSAEIINKTL